MTEVVQVAFRLSIAAFFVLTPFTLASAQKYHVNFSHLQHLTETISMSGENVDIVHVYANYPDYRWLEASDAGTEGVACVDDAARAAIVYLRHYEFFNDNESLGRAKALLAFVLKMQSDDGEFYNFIYKDHTINRTGRTSLKSFGWWASRGVWCLGTAYRVFKSVDPVFAGALKAAVERSLPHVNILLSRHGVSDTVSGFPVPRWLPYESGADVTSELLLGLVDLYVAEPGKNLKLMIEQLAGGIMMMQSGNLQRSPFGLHRSWETRWHMWGNSQTQVLAVAGRVLKNKSFVASAEQEALGFYGHLLIDGFLKEWDLASSQPPLRFEQIAYAVRPMAVGLLRLYDVTGNRDYLVMAGLAASWLFGNNVLNRPMYDPATGRCFDGIRDSVTINLNSGAESTIEALYTLVEIEQYPMAVNFLSYRRVSSGRKNGYDAALFRNDRGEEVTMRIDQRRGALSILKNEASRLFQEQRK